ncbi:MAG TPA: tetratricopeptide repeat protein [Bryobacteraceae bacterium]|nr:tetratricopeptide repeat protein [Bryobacteraceae bacterium]
MRIVGLLVVIASTASAWSQPLPSEAQRQERIKQYEQITRDNPRDVEMWHILAGLYRDSELWDKAIAAEGQAIQRHPKYAVAFWGRGKARIAKEDYAAAVDDLTSAIKLYEARGGVEMYLTLEQPSEEYIDCYRSRGVAQAHLNRYPDGITDLSTALRLRKDDAKLLYERGYLEEKGGRKVEAIADYQRSGLIYADAHARQPAEECLTHLDALGAKAEADAVRRKMEPKKAKSDLP